MRRISNSENQIAKKLNASDKIYDTELDEINKNQEAILQGLNQIITSLAKLD